jgi:hypothetical protein
MKWTLSAFAILFWFTNFSAFAATQQQNVETRGQAWAEATSHADRVTKEYPDVTVIVDTKGGALTVYYFSKPSCAAFPAWIRDQWFPDDHSISTKSCDTCHDNILAFANWKVPSEKAFVEGFQQLMGQNSN